MSKLKNSGNKICRRTYVEILGKLASPLSICSGEEQETDGDVLQSADGIPFIPGSTIAGVLKDYTRRIYGKRKASTFFGMEKGGESGSQEDRQSRIFCYDAYLKNSQIIIRDGVKLDEYKTAQSKSKYERQAVERGAAFRMRLELVEREDCFTKEKSADEEKTDGFLREFWDGEQSLLKVWTWGFQSGELRVGGKSSRGFGKLSIEKVRRKSFNMGTDWLKWLDWDWEFSDDEILEIQDLTNPFAKESKEGFLEKRLEVDLEIPYTLMVRSYNIALGKDGGADYAHITVGGQGKSAVIPGSSFAGAFRSHLAKLVSEYSGLGWKEAQRRLGAFFGTWKEEGKEKLTASRVIFEEALIEGGHRLPIIRNSIDRFTGGTVKGALFEEVPWVGGNATLRIRWKKGNDSSIICGLLLWAVQDMLEGILPIGGETAVGRGILKAAGGKKIIRIDGEELDLGENSPCVEEASVLNKEVNDCMKQAMDWCKEKGTKSNGTD